MWCQRVYDIYLEDYCDIMKKYVERLHSSHGKMWRVFVKKLIWFVFVYNNFKVEEHYMSNTVNFIVFACVHLWDLWTLDPNTRLPIANSGK